MGPVLWDALALGTQQLFTVFRMKINVRKLLSNSSGSVLLFVLVAISVFSFYVYLSATKFQTQAQMSMSQEADKDIESAASLIGSILMSPAHCNANFRLLPLTNSEAQLSALKKCAIGAKCIGLPGEVSVFLPVIPSTSGNWDPAYTKLTHRVRLVGLSWINKQYLSGAPTYRASILTVNMQFQKNMGLNPITHMPKTSIVKKTIDVYFLDFNELYIKGCPKAPMSNTLYL